MEQFSTTIFLEENAEGSSISQNDLKANIVSHYKELNLYAIKSNQELYL